jgi:hypothetical protein
MKIIRIKNLVIRQGMKNSWDEFENLQFFGRGGVKSEEYNLE